MYICIYIYIICNGPSYEAEKLEQIRMSVCDAPQLAMPRLDALRRDVPRHAIAGCDSMVLHRAFRARRLTHVM